MKRAVESPEEKAERVKAETTELLAGAVARITERILDPRLAPFTAEAKEAAGKIAQASRGLSGVASQVDQRLQAIDAKVATIGDGLGITELRTELSASRDEVVASLAACEGTVHERVRQAARELALKVDRVGRNIDVLITRQEEMATWLQDTATTLSTRLDALDASLKLGSTSKQAEEAAVVLAEIGQRLSSAVEVQHEVLQAAARARRCALAAAILAAISLAAHPVLLTWLK